MRFMRVLSIVILCFTLSGCSLFFPAEEELLAPPLVMPEEVTYRTMEVTTGDIEEKIEMYANFVPSRYATMSFEGQGGRVTEIPIKLGQMVKKGDLLIELDSESIKRQIRQQQFVVEKAQLYYDSVQLKKDETYDVASLEMARIDLRMQEQKLINLEIDAEEAKRTWDANRENIYRNRDEQMLIVQKEQIALQKKEELYTKWLAEQEGDLPTDRKTQIEQARLDLAMAQNSMKNLTGDLERARLFAPFDGIVAYVLPNMDVGQNVEAYVPLIRISDPTQLLLTYKGDKASSLVLGMQVQISFKGTSYIGKVAADPQSIPMTDGKAIPQVQFVIDELPLGDIVMGDDAKVVAVLQSQKDVIILPKNCINSFWGRKFVNILQDGIKVERDVEIGIETATQVEIKKGLAVGELIIQP